LRAGGKGVILSEEMEKDTMAAAGGCAHTCHSGHLCYILFSKAAECKEEKDVIQQRSGC